ncbi:inactive polypeptide N-acetylgalactosaminyltransferase-like protein 5 [Gigantopelta aegis]|uniref:inactive polypeptide N-acetylgalactosaminyltransferase-like protein 5 n=1 Tax=Gigantopelta aegis TaxID=1735272 RepID=UPI001B88827E|nr:inactive polypeptide N-acetylgalactosaminyltransferase-like protein 5 [Gigantopelta aegis]
MAFIIRKLRPKRLLRYSVLLIAPITWLAVLVVVPLHYDINSRSEFESRQRNGSLVRKNGIKSRAKLSIKAPDEVKVSMIQSVAGINGNIRNDLVEQNLDIISSSTREHKSEKRQRLLANMGPGAWGMPVKVDEKKLTAEQQQRLQQGWSSHNFNQYVSDMISLHRTVPDFRSSACRARVYPSDLPAASVIICFHNEALSTLLRTVHSVLDRTPDHLLQQILLIDDFSANDDLQDSLDTYLASYSKVKLVRSSHRLGLVRARLLGVSMTTAPILVFLDSHCECAEGWLEPLVMEIYKNSSSVLTPIIDIIDKNTFHIVGADNNLGGFSIESMTFEWIRVPRRIAAMRKSAADPFISPTMAGGLFAISKEFFFSIGSYDPGFEVWGGENLEISLRIWMCGGQIMTSPCSRVSHVFRDKSPYINAGAEFIGKNAHRVAKLWLDEYEPFFFKNFGYFGGDVSERLKLKETLHCQSFDWYLEHVFPELYVRGSGQYLGQVRHVSSGLCLTTIGKNIEIRRLHLAQCSVATYWESTRQHQIRNADVCLEATREDQPHPFATECLDSKDQQEFSYGKDGTIRLLDSGSCLTVDKKMTPDFVPCTFHPSLMWHWPKNQFFQTSRTVEL